MGSNIQITYIKNDPAGKDTTSKLNEEYIVIKNLGDTIVDMNKWLVTDFRPNQQHIHKYTFSNVLSDKSVWTFDPGEVIFLKTGSGLDVFIPKDDSHPPQFHLYWNSGWFIWNNTGDTACLFDPNGVLISQLKVT